MRRPFALLLALFLVTGCSEPPQQEIDQAQGALDAARAAGAEQYAASEFTAAAAALQEAHDAVTQRDYRLALSRALDANQRAQEAARDAADGKAHARSSAEASLRLAMASVQQLETRVAALDEDRGLKTLVADATTALADERGALQEAREKIAAGLYLEAAEVVKGVPTRVSTLLGTLDEASSAKGARRKR